MQWHIMKGVLMAFPIFFAMGIIGNIIGALTFFIFTKTKSNNINGFLKFSIILSFIVGVFFFCFTGMFYAAFTVFLYTYMTKWLSIIIVILYLLLLTKYTFKEIRPLHEKNTRIPAYDFYEKGKYFKHMQVVNENILLSCMVLFPSYIFFLIFNDFADKLSFGLNSWLLSL